MAKMANFMLYVFSHSKNDNKEIEFLNNIQIS